MPRRWPSAATKEGVLRWGEAPAWNPNWFDFTTCNGGGKFVTLDVVERIDITAAAGSTTRGDYNWVFVFDQAFAGSGPEGTRRRVGWRTSESR